MSVRRFSICPKFISDVYNFLSFSRSTIPITPYHEEPCQLQQMDDLIDKIQYHCLYLKIYKREKKDDPKRIAEVEDTQKTKEKLIGQLHELVKNWPYVPLCVEDLLEKFPLSTL